MVKFIRMLCALLGVTQLILLLQQVCCAIMDILWIMNCVQQLLRWDITDKPTCFLPIQMKPKNIAAIIFFGMRRYLNWFYKTIFGIKSNVKVYLLAQSYSWLNKTYYHISSEICTLYSLWEFFLATVTSISWPFVFKKPLFLQGKYTALPNSGEVERRNWSCR